MCKSALVQHFSGLPGAMEYMRFRDLQLHRSRIRTWSTRWRGDGVIVNVAEAAPVGPSTCNARVLSHQGQPKCSSHRGGRPAQQSIVMNADCQGWVATNVGEAGGKPLEDGAVGITWAALLGRSAPMGQFFRQYTAALVGHFWPP